MTTQTTTIEESSGGLRTLVGATAVMLAVLVGAALWLVWPGGGAATAPATAPVTAARDGTAPLSGSVEQYPEDQRAATAHEAPPAAMQDGLAQLGGEQAEEVRRYVYLVDSEAGATAVRQMSAQADLVLVVETEEDVSQILVGLSRRGMAIVDMRTAAGRMRAPLPDQPTFVD
jgi:hypothetical protein